MERFSLGIRLGQGFFLNLSPSRTDSNLTANLLQDGFRIYPPQRALSLRGPHY